MATDIIDVEEEYTNQSSASVSPSKTLLNTDDIKPVDEMIRRGSVGDSGAESADDVFEDEVTSKQGNGLNILAMISAKMLRVDEMNGGGDDDFSDQENAPQKMFQFARNPERHRVLERARRGRLRSVMDELMSKLPDALWQRRYPNKAKRSQIDVVNLAIEHITFLEDLLRDNDMQIPQPDPEKERQDFDQGYVQCAQDLLRIAKQNQIEPMRGCRDTRSLMSYIQLKAFPKDATLRSSQPSSSLLHKSSKRPLEANHYSINTDSLQMSVFKRAKTQQYPRVSEEHNHAGYIRTNVPKIRLNRPAGQSLLVNHQKDDSPRKRHDSVLLTPASSPSHSPSSA